MDTPCKQGKELVLSRAQLSSLTVGSPPDNALEKTGRRLGRICKQGKELVSSGSLTVSLGLGIPLDDTLETIIAQGRQGRVTCLDPHAHAHVSSPYHEEW
jgi:hypothetical protein